MSDIRHKIPLECVDLLEDVRLLLGKLEDFHVQSTRIGHMETVRAHRGHIALEVSQATQYMEKADTLRQKIHRMLYPTDESLES